MSEKSRTPEERVTKKASFWVEAELWERFMQRASDNKTTGTAVLLKAIRAYLGDEEDVVSPTQFAELRKEMAAIEQRVAIVEKRSPVATT